MNNYLREPVNGFTHLAGAILSFAGLLALVIKTALQGHSTIALTAVIIFGISMILLYAASATYHLVVSSDKVISFLRRLDHSMIFLLIAGSYTPFCLIALEGTTGWVLFSIIITIAIVGISFKLIWFNCPRWLSTSINGMDCRVPNGPTKRISFFTRFITTYHRRCILYYRGYNLCY